MTAVKLKCAKLRQSSPKPLLLAVAEAPLTQPFQCRLERVTLGAVALLSVLASCQLSPSRPRTEVLQRGEQIALGGMGVTEWSFGLKYVDALGRPGILLDADYIQEARSLIRQGKSMC